MTRVLVTTAPARPLIYQHAQSKYRSGRGAAKTHGPLPVRGQRPMEFLKPSERTFRSDEGAYTLARLKFSQTHERTAVIRPKAPAHRGTLGTPTASRNAQKSSVAAKIASPPTRRPHRKWGGSSGAWCAVVASFEDTGSPFHVGPESRVVRADDHARTPPEPEDTNLTQLLGAHVGGVPNARIGPPSSLVGLRYPLRELHAPLCLRVIRFGHVQFPALPAPVHHVPRAFHRRPGKRAGNRPVGRTDVDA